MTFTTGEVGPVQVDDDLNGMGLAGGNEAARTRQDQGRAQLVPGQQSRRLPVLAAQGRLGRRFPLDEDGCYLAALRCAADVRNDAGALRRFGSRVHDGCFRMASSPPQQRLHRYPRLLGLTGGCATTHGRHCIDLGNRGRPPSAYASARRSSSGRSQVRLGPDARCMPGPHSRLPPDTLKHSDKQRWGSSDRGDERAVAVGVVTRTSYTTATHG